MHQLDSELTGNQISYQLEASGFSVVFSDDDKLTD